MSRLRGDAAHWRMSITIRRMDQVAVAPCQNHLAEKDHRVSIGSKAERIPSILTRKSPLLALLRR